MLQDCNFQLYKVLCCIFILTNILKVGYARRVNFLIFARYEQARQQMELSFVKCRHESSSFMDIEIKELKAVLNGHEPKLKSKHTLRN